MRRSLSILALSLITATAALGLGAAERRGARTAPVGWDPGLAQPLAADDRLAAATALPVGDARGPEDLAPLPDGRLAVGVADGRLLALDPTGAAPPALLTRTGGRPLGLAAAPDGGLFICDASEGLLRWSADEGLRPLATAADGLPFGFTNAVDVAPDGAVYFTDASWRYGFDDLVVDLLDGRPHGRLLAYDPTTRETRTLEAELGFANGVAVDPSGDFVLVAETWRYRVLRRWLRGPKAGAAEVFIDGLPGFPDGISAAPAGGRARFWLSVFSPRSALGDFVAPRPGLRRVLLGLPRALWPLPARAGIVLGLDEEGAVVDVLRDASGRQVAGVTSARQVGDQLYLGNLDAPHLSRLPAPR